MYFCRNYYLQRISYVTLPVVDSAADCRQHLNRASLSTSNLDKPRHTVPEQMGQTQTLVLVLVVSQSWSLLCRLSEGRTLRV
jgi:hypothetical protein